MEARIFGGSSNPALTQSVCQALGLPPGRLKLQYFPDGEKHVEFEENIQGRQIYIIQTTAAPVAENLLELLLIADAGWRASTGTIIAIVPYLGYARQDRRLSGSEAIGARLVANLLGSSGLAGLIAVDLHNPSVEGFFTLPLQNLSAVPLLAAAAQKAGAEVVVSADLGAAKLAEHYGALLNLPVALVHKTRLTSSQVKAHSVVGEVRGKKPLIVDDIISTAGTLEAAVQALTAAGCRAEISVAATHGLLVGPAVQRLRALHLDHIFLSNSVDRPSGNPLPLQVIDLGPLLAEAIRRSQKQESMVDLLAHL